MVRAGLILSALVFNLLAFSGLARAEIPPLPQNADATHLGVASCASSVCHGAINPKEEGNVLQNEYRTWSQYDRHARAYKTLLSDASKAMAKKLGLEAAHTAKVCLDCHTDNVAAGKRGTRFQLSDGIGCEGCHGGAEKWIKSHTEPSTTHAQNVAAGLYPTEDPHARAELCLSCHLGTSEKLASHDIMGAGHPRLSFELDTFTVLQPEHYKLDDDYRKRKGPVTPPQVWLAGQLRTAQQTLELLASGRFHDGGMFPEISFYDCHACHHPMNQLRWQPGDGLKPGALRLNDASLQLTAIVLGVLAPDHSAPWRDAMIALQRAGQKSPAAVGQQAQAMNQQLTPWMKLTEQPLSRVQQAGLAKALLREGARGTLRDYTSAEQMVMGVALMITSLGLEKAMNKSLDTLYNALEDEHRFDPARLSKMAGQVQAELERRL